MRWDCPITGCRIPKPDSPGIQKSVSGKQQAAELVPLFLHLFVIHLALSFDDGPKSFGELFGTGLSDA